MELAGSPGERPLKFEDFVILHLGSPLAHVRRLPLIFRGPLVHSTTLCRFAPVLKRQPLPSLTLHRSVGARS